MTAKEEEEVRKHHIHILFFILGCKYGIAKNMTLLSFAIHFFPAGRCEILHNSFLLFWSLFSELRSRDVEFLITLPFALRITSERMKDDFP